MRINKQQVCPVDINAFIPNEPELITPNQSITGSSGFQIRPLGKLEHMCHMHVMEALSKAAMVVVYHKDRSNLLSNHKGAFHGFCQKIQPEDNSENECDGGKRWTWLAPGNSLFRRSSPTRLFGTKILHCSVCVIHLTMSTP